MRFSAIIPVFNRAHSIGAAIQSVLDQTPRPDEVIVVDDGSTDDLPSALDPFLDRITLIRQPNSGVSSARNAGAAPATGDWLTFLDSDDLWLPDRMAVLHRDLAQTPSSVVAHVGDMRLVGKGYDQSFLGLKGLAFPDEKAVLVDDPLPMVISGMGFQVSAVRRDAWTRIGGLDPLMRIHEDTAFFARLAIEGPFLFTGRRLASVQRLEEDVSPLSALTRTEPLYARQMYVRLLERLGDLDLSPAQSELVQRKLSGALFQLAEALSWTDPVAAREVLRKAAQNHPSPLKGWTKSIIAGALGARGYRIALGRDRGFERK